MHEGNWECKEKATSTNKKKGEIQPKTMGSNYESQGLLLDFEQTFWIESLVQIWIWFPSKILEVLRLTTFESISQIFITNCIRKTKIDQIPAKRLQWNITILQTCQT